MLVALIDNILVSIRDRLDCLKNINYFSIFNFSEIIQTCIKIKLSLVDKDPNEKNIRMLLNFGHTVGHALEAADGYRIKHGAAVSIGMVAEARLSCLLGFLAVSAVEEIILVLKQLGLPTDFSGIGQQISELIDFIKKDKKAFGGKIRIVLLRKIGEAFVSEVSLEQIAKIVG